MANVCVELDNSKILADKFLKLKDQTCYKINKTASLKDKTHLDKKEILFTNLFHYQNL